MDFCQNNFFDFSRNGKIKYLKSVFSEMALRDKFSLFNVINSMYGLNVVLLNVYIFFATILLIEKAN